ncbi:leucyl/phenylalanyl-tRNA--protein transferase [Pelagibaculum spongiae]|uniref:Leucyl/phenylalanyl-tRNA--protein transferase n=1 Tax=Pelagibaculum spongiae TaxID=2080658 RepID=A0A2V1GWD5_9GAMM|nr:leucyl/phenylalanyl-tRNA--protein transferase [Pelagibaculum spongiae]PVZ71491.1 leucyl/phenylalanyl-tRNA--protein transferase [Pelagibaculum spongiae]
MNRLLWLDEHSALFPSPEMAMNEPNGLLAAGGDLSPKRLISAYSNGIFPWYGEDDPILWWSPAPRCVFYPGQVKVSRSLAKRLRQKKLHVTMDQEFDRVIEACSAPRDDQPGTWLSPEMIEAYQNLHQLGYAHSLEVWQDQQLVGGLYGVSLGRMFFGESMFSRVSDASKIALVYLSGQLQSWQFDLIDCQLPTAHLASMGAIEINRDQFLGMLADNRQQPDRTGKWNLQWSWSE